MATFASLLPTIIPAATTITSDIINAVKGTPAPGSTSGSTATLSGPMATAITNAPGFATSVSAKDQTGAANAAAAVVPDAINAAVASGVQTALKSANSAQQNLGAQLKSVVQLLDSSYPAEDYLFAIYQVVSNKSTLATEDTTLLKIWWNAADTNIKNISATTAAGLSDEAAKNAFQQVAAQVGTPTYVEIGTDLGTVGSVPTRLVVNTSALLNMVSAAALVGRNTINQISAGLQLLS